MVKSLIDTDSKTTKYIIDNKIIEEKEKDMNLNLRKIIVNSPVRYKLKTKQHLMELKNIMKENSLRNPSTDSSEDETAKGSLRLNSSKEEDIFIQSPQNTTEKNKNFTFSPLKSSVLSKVERLNKTESLKDGQKKDKDSKHLNFIEIYNIPESPESNANNHFSKVQLIINQQDKGRSKSLLNDNVNPWLKNSNSSLKNEIDMLNNNKREGVLINQSILNNKNNNHAKIEKNNNYSRKNYDNFNDSNESSQKNNTITIPKKFILNMANSNIIQKINNQFTNRNPFFKTNNNKFQELLNQGTNSNSNSNGIPNSNDYNNPVRITLNKKLDSNSLENFQMQNVTLNPLHNSNRDLDPYKEMKSMEEFKKLRAKKINHSVISAHSIIDYSMNNKSEYINREKKHNTSSALNLIDKQEKERHNIINEKIKMGNEKIKELISKTKEKGYYGPYFSLCGNCNERNLQFYENINERSAINILKVIGNN